MCGKAQREDRLLGGSQFPWSHFSPFVNQSTPGCMTIFSETLFGDDWPS